MGGRAAVRLRRGGAALACLTVGAWLAPAPEAGAELVQRGDLFVGVEGDLAPRALPRHKQVPVSLRFASRVRSLSNRNPPALRRIEIALSRGGRIQTRGLPRCHRSQIRAATTADALEECRQALVGRGTFVAGSAFPEGPGFTSRGRLLAFNTRAAGKPAILAHLYGTFPVASTRLITFRISRGAGRYGTVLRGMLPASVNRWGYLKRISLRLSRRFSFRGRTRSYISASCPAPPGFPGASFALARTTMAFEDGRMLSSVLVRTCRVRRGG